MSLVSVQNPMFSPPDIEAMEILIHRLTNPNTATRLAQALLTQHEVMYTQETPLLPISLAGYAKGRGSMLFSLGTQATENSEARYILTFHTNPFDDYLEISTIPSPVDRDAADLLTTFLATTYLQTFAEQYPEDLYFAGFVLMVGLASPDLDAPACHPPHQKISPAAATHLLKAESPLHIPATLSTDT